MLGGGSIDWLFWRNFFNFVLFFHLSFWINKYVQVHRQITKQVKATVWMAQDYPLKLKHIMPALEILSVRVSNMTGINSIRLGSNFFRYVQCFILSFHVQVVCWVLLLWLLFLLNTIWRYSIPNDRYFLF